MKRLIAACVLLLAALPFAFGQRKTIVATGSGVSANLLKEIIALTGKDSARVCFVPTAGRDSDKSLEGWRSKCAEAGIEPRFLKVWVSSDTKETFEEIIMGSDAIVVGGGNTLNMMGIWHAQGIDTLLVKAYSKGIVLAGGSAGAICWFESGISDSRPVEICSVDGLGLLPCGVCPHFEKEARKEVFRRKLSAGEMTPGYALDSPAGIVFFDGKSVDFFTEKEGSDSYTVSLSADGQPIYTPNNSRLLGAQLPGNK